MADLKDRMKKETTPTEKVILGITDTAPKKEKYPVSVVFDGEYEKAIRDKAKSKGVGPVTFIKMCVIEKLNED